MRSSSPEFESACQLAIHRAGDLVPLGRDRIVENLRICFDHAGEYVAYIDRMKTVKNARRLCRKVLACGRSLKDVQHAVESASASDRSEVVVAYIEEDDEGPQFPYELRGR